MKPEVIDQSGCDRRPIEVGERFGRLVVISLSRDAIKKGRLHECRCDCGGTTNSLEYNLLRGLSKSCGCARREKCSRRMTKHGMHGTRAYQSWYALIKRCENRNVVQWDNYGGRGITVCDRWRASFQDFYNDMGDPPVGMSIDRIDNDGNYCKENCRWATRVTQRRNRSDIRIIEYDGESMCLTDWAKRLGINYVTLFNRLKTGWSVEKAFTKEVRQSKKGG